LAKARPHIPDAQDDAKRASTESTAIPTTTIGRDHRAECCPNNTWSHDQEGGNSYEDFLSATGLIPPPPALRRRQAFANNACMGDASCIFGDDFYSHGAVSPVSYDA